MSSTARSTLLPFQPCAMTPAQLAAVSYLARYSGHTHALYGYQSGADSPGVRRALGPLPASSAPTSSSTSVTSARRDCVSPRSGMLHSVRGFVRFAHMS